MGDATVNSVNSRWFDYLQKSKDQDVRPLLKEALASYCPKTYEHLPALDVGCGACNESRELLKIGWNVVGIDYSGCISSLVLDSWEEELRSRFQFINCPFQTVPSFPKAKFIWAYHALPFCMREEFFGTWDKLVTALVPGGLFSGSFFGDRDGWNTAEFDKLLTFLTRSELNDMFHDFEVIKSQEMVFTSKSFGSETKQWHFYEVIARRR